ncbi:TM0106 family RecB-like putative nuclease [Oscillatoria sp. FACHB-1407]|uniref:TM0106 family RecB-like putative nuclease n=1 Tax=Oscillatoria sp. FACHB-1407 TaxID=2692847 RepID=UPI00281650B2|nr:TM0106 family RecB-like putative nuclease [Oscillatoria sp. FACHB-1407]
MLGKLPANADRPDFVEADVNSTASPIWMSNHADLAAIAASNPQLWLTNELLFNYQRCRRRAYLDVFGDWEQSDPPSDYLLKLRQDSYNHQLLVMAESPVEQAHYTPRDWLAGAAATLDLMQKGVDRIARAVLLLPQDNDIVLVSCPDLLIKEPGASYFGNWRYVPTEIKLGKRPKLDYQITAAFHAYVLAAVQGAWSETSFLVLRQRGAYPVDLVELLPKMQTVLDDCIQMLSAQQEPDVFIAHNRCDLCHWFSHCYGIATRDRHLSLLPGVTPSRYIHLENLQLTTVESLAAAHPHQLESLPGFGTQVAHRLIRQAQSTLQQRAMVKPFEPDVTPNPLLTKAEIPTEPIELYFDIEAAPEQNLVYLHGVLVVDRLQQTETFYPLLADRPEDEGVIWQQFIDLVWQYPTAPIFHFCPYEVQTVKRLAEYYGTPYRQIEPLLTRFIDLHERVTRVAILPVESYALKPIARWLGFNWRDQGANGAQSIYWYSEWLSTGDRTFLDAILCYNEDDCRATHKVKDWLAEFVKAVYLGD